MNLTDRLKEMSGILNMFGEDANFFTGKTPEQRARGAGQIGWESVPFISEAVTVRDIKSELAKEEPNWWAIGLLGGAGVLGVIPFLGDIAGNAIRQGVKARNAVKLNPAQQQSQDVLDSLKSGKADQVTDEMLANADQEYLSKNYDLPMDTESRMARAKEMGLDTDTKQFHGTSSDEFPSFEKDRIGSASDEGFYGKGFYFVPYKGEASYYGKNVGEYFLPKSKDILNLSNETNDSTFYPIEYFKQWNQKFEDLGVLDETQKKSFQAVKKLDNYVNKNVKYLPLRHSDGTEGIIAKVDFPDKYDPEYPREITSTLSAYDSRNMPKTEEEALADLKRQVIHETSFNSELKKQFEGIGDTTWSISDYIRSDWKIPEKLSEKVAEKGYKGINVGDETVIFEPENIRKTDARFDPRLRNLKNLSAGIPLGLLPFIRTNNNEEQDSYNGLLK